MSEATVPHSRLHALVGLSLLVVAGCGGPQLTPGAPPPTPADIAAIVAANKTGEPCRPILTDPGEIVYEGLGVRTYPAPNGTPARLTAQDALGDADVQGWGPGSSREVELRLVSTGDFGCESHPTGAVRRAGWVVTIRGTFPGPSGPPNAPRPDPAPACYSVVILDARTGAVLSNFQICGG